MKKFLLSLLVVAAGLTSFSSIAQVEGGGAKIEFKKDTHDYGNVKYGADGTCTFEFTNTGDAPLIISNAKGSCGCTVPSWPKEPIAPGASSVITVKYDTKRPGAIAKSVTITSNATNEPNKVIRIKGTVLPAPENGTPVNTTGPAN
jgi:Protein of unknown function (DUF1573)